MSDASDERQIAYWQAPMNPAEIYDEPGKSRMGMDLVPVYADEMEPETMPAGDGAMEMPTDGAGPGGGASTITINSQTVQKMGVRWSPVERRDFSRLIRTVGEVAYDDEKIYIVNSKISGWIERLFVNFVGEEVRAGEPLMEIYSPEIVSTQEEFLLAIQNVRMIAEGAPEFVREDAESLLEASRKRLEYWDIPEDEIARLEAGGEVRKTISINSPATGVVVEQHAVVGAHVGSGQDLFKIADLSTVWVHASFFDNEVPWIQVGQQVEMELSYLPGKTYTGRVSYIYPFLREKSRDVHVRLIFENTASLDLKPGMYANVQLTGRTIQDALVIPSEAVIRSGARIIAFVVLGEGRFEPREIRIGEIGGEGNAEIRVLEGLSEGEEVVISAQFLLDSESRLQEAIQKMLAVR